MENKNKLFKRGDFILIAVLLFICGTVFLFRYCDKSEQLYAEISCNGEILYSIDFNEINEAYDIEIGSVVIGVEPNTVYFKSSDCNDKTCVKTGKLSHINDTGACLPNGIVITIKGNKKSTVDIITY